MAMNFEQARVNMVENQVRTWDVLDPRVLGTLGRVRREDFVAPAHRQLAFADLCLPLAHDEVMMKPVVEGRILQALALDPTERVLEIGTGSGFFCGCLADLAGHVTSVDIHDDFIAAAGQRLAAAGIRNVALTAAEAVRAWQPTEKFDVIVATGAVATLPERWLEWLAPAGRILVIQGLSPAQQVRLITFAGGKPAREESLFETDLPYLTHAAPVPAFVF